MEPGTVLLLALPCQRGAGVQHEQLAKADQRDVPCHVVPCSAVRVGIKKQEGGDVQSDRVCLPKKPFPLMSSAFLQVAEHLTADGEQRMSSLFCFACVLGFCFI